MQVQTEVFGDEQSVHLVHFPILEEAFRDYTRLRKDAYTEEAFREKLRAKLAALEADTAEKLSLYNPEDAQPFRGAIDLPKDFHKERQPERMDYLMALFRNTLLAEYLTTLFPEEKKPGQPEAREDSSFGEKLATKVRQVLEKRGQLDQGRFTGNSTHVKALYNVLANGTLKGIYKEKRFADFFLKHFGFRITSRTLQNPPNKGQDTEESKYQKLLQ